MPIDFTNISYHVLHDRQSRYNVIERTIGFGSPVCTFKDETDKTYKTLTSTGVIIIRNFMNMIITLYIARPMQAKKLYVKATNEKMPKKLDLMVQYNNNTTYWKEYATAQGIRRSPLFFFFFLKKVLDKQPVVCYN